MESKEKLQHLHRHLTSMVLGSEKATTLLLIALLARGHSLIEGPPGVGKTSLARILAQALGGNFKRVQFTPDLLPTDLLGYSLYRPHKENFQFIPGPIFTNVLLADEINRASPRTQSALLECMNDLQVSLDGTTRTLPSPFFVIATRNDADTRGTYPLPLPQLDRFLLSIQMDLPSRELQNRALLDHASGNIDDFATESAIDLSLSELLELQKAVFDIPLSEILAAYIIDLCETTRRLSGNDHSVSLRASLAVMNAARACAFLEGSDVLLPDHIQEVFPAVMHHRLVLNDYAEPLPLLQSVLETTPVP